MFEKRYPKAAEMMNIVGNGRGAEMDTYGKQLGKQQVQAVVDYYRGLAKKKVHAGLVDSVGPRGRSVARVDIGRPRPFHAFARRQDPGVSGAAGSSGRGRRSCISGAHGSRTVPRDAKLWEEPPHRRSQLYSSAPLPKQSCAAGARLLHLQYHLYALRRSTGEDPWIAASLR